MYPGDDGVPRTVPPWTSRGDGLVLLAMVVIALALSVFLLGITTSHRRRLAELEAARPASCSPCALCAACTFAVTP